MPLSVCPPRPLRPVPAADDVAGSLGTRLNQAQREAADHGDTPLLVVAGAGTGKTATLAARCARLIEAGADPARMLLLTFSRRAASELAHRCALRLRRRPGQPPVELRWAGTFHAVGARLLRELAAQAGLPPGFTVLDRGDAEDLMALARQGLDLDRSSQRFPQARTCLAIYSRCVNAERALDEVLARHFGWCRPWADELGRLFARYVDLKQAQAVLDYDDLLLHWAQAMQVPALAEPMRARFDHVLVDEYQDTNRLQAGIVRGLCPDGSGLTVVGDDAQAIYGFRAAEVANILDFPQHFDPPARVITLAQNYRSTPAILAAANAVLEQMPRAHAKRLFSHRPAGARPRLVTPADEAAQARWAADEVLRQREAGVALRRQAVLFRTGSHSAGLELELHRRDIPFVKFGGLRFIESTHVKDLMALLRLAQNPSGSLAAARALRLVAGVGPATVRRLLAIAAEAPQDKLGALLRHDPGARLRPSWQPFTEAVRALVAPSARWPGSLDPLLDWYRSQLPRWFEDAAVREQDLLQLRRLAGASPGRERFLAELTLDPPQASSDLAGEPHQDEDYLVLSTIHAAKGQEWSAVQLLNVVDGCLPSDLATGSAAELDEERRLLYVAMTRARDTLTLLVPHRFHLTQQARLGDLHVQAVPSRFLTPAVMEQLDLGGDMPGQEQPLVDPRRSPGADARFGAAAPLADLGALARQAWRR